MKEKELLKLKEKVLKCKKCDLYKTKTNCVFGEGDFNAKIMFVGEAPGRNEDLQGKPFVGAAGKFLNELLDFIGLRREEIFITNILKCRPPGNRNPKSNEIKACTPYLDKQIELIKPKIICTLGNFATSYIMKKFGLEPKSMGKIHGKIFKIKNLTQELKIIPLYHPAAAIYNPNMKKILLEDFKKIKSS